MKSTKEYIELLNHWTGLTRSWKFTGAQKPKNSVDLDINDISSTPESIPMEIFTAINAVTIDLTSRIRQQEKMIQLATEAMERQRKESDLAREVRDQ